ncbi:MAG: hypothetical protein WBA64_04705 [Marinomonas sp.]|uniref:hypothetical protein n=1 Tax=Marinomonas sp. TaxID=1904862 RepID=UPI003C727FB0
MFEWRFRYILSLFFILSLVLGGRVVYLTLNSENVDRADLITVTRTPLSFQKLNSHIDELEEMSKNIDTYTLGEIKDITKKTTYLLNQVGIELKAQHESWSDIQNLFEGDAEKFKQLRVSLDKAQQLNNKELLRIKNVMDQANQRTITEELSGTTLSFVFGVSTSIVASYLIKMFQRRKRKVHNNIT